VAAVSDGTKRRNTSPNAESRKAQGVAMLIGGARHAEVAEACGVSTRQVARWVEESDVRERVADAAAEAAATAREVLVGGAREAAEVLLGEMRGADSSGDRIRAALAVLDRSGHGPSARLESTGKDGGPMEVRVDSLPTEPAARAELRATLIERARALTAKLEGGE